MKNNEPDWLVLDVNAMTNESIGGVTVRPRQEKGYSIAINAVAVNLN